ncbi:DUF4303 domain-containing protein [Vallitalea sediminicola]
MCIIKRLKRLLSYNGIESKPNKTNKGEGYTKVKEMYILDEDTRRELNRIKVLLIDATKKHFSKLVQEFGEGNIYGYTLYTCDDATSVGPVANRITDFTKDKNDPLYSYYRYGAQEWTLWDDYGFFNEVNHMLRELVERHYDEVIEFHVFRQEIFSLFLSVLTILKEEKVFLNMSSESYLAVWVSDSDSEITSESVRVLNNDDVYLEYAKEYGI